MHYIYYDKTLGCDQCVAAMINGVFCHEHGCPNAVGWTDRACTEGPCCKVRSILNDAGFRPDLELDDSESAAEMKSDVDSP